MGGRSSTATRFEATERDRAFHEAGHCWAFWTLGIRFRYTTLRPRRAGLDATTVLGRDWTIDDIREQPRVALAGLLAEAIHRLGVDLAGPDRPEHLAAVDSGAQHDLQTLEDFLVPEELGPLLLVNLRSHWAGVTAVAEELLTERTLAGSRVFAILDEALAEAPRLERMPLSLLPGFDQAIIDASS